MSTTPTIALDAQALDPSFDPSKQSVNPKAIVSSEPVQLKPSTNQTLPSAVQPLPTPKDILDTTVEGAKQVAQGTRDIGQGPSSGTSISDAIHNTIQGAMKVGTIPMMFAAAVDPLLAARGLAESAGGEYAAKKTAAALGASPETAQLAGDIAAVGVPSAAHMLPERPEGSAFGENPEAGFAKIGGKKVRGATPKPAAKPSEPLQQGWILQDGTHVPLEDNETHASAVGRIWPEADPYEKEGLNRGAIRVHVMDYVPNTPLEISFQTDKLDDSAKQRIGDALLRAPEDTKVVTVGSSAPYGHPDRFQKLSFEDALNTFPTTPNRPAKLAAVPGAKFVGKAPEPAEPVSAPAETAADVEKPYQAVEKTPETAASVEKPYHPDLQKVIDLPGVKVHTDPKQVTEAAHFVTPDGKFVRLPAGLDHDAAINTVKPDQTEYDPRINFINDTGAVRIRPTADKGGQNLAVQVPTQGITPEQVDVLKQAVGQGMKSHGNLTLETAAIPTDQKSEYKDVASPRDVEPMLRKIGAQPELAEFSSKGSDFVGEDFLPKDSEDKMYHVTTAKNKVLSEGLKSRKQTGSAGLGGGFMNQAPNKISVTFDEGHANQIASRMNLAVQAAKDKVTPQQVLDTMISDAGIADDTPAEVGQMLGSPESVKEDWEDFNKWFAENYKQGDSYSLLQELDDALPSIYTETTSPVRVGFTASKNQMAKIKPNQIHIFEVEARKGAKPEHIPDESELRFAPADVRVVQSSGKK